ncbi:hypothetical protein [Phaeovulum sp. W22_SRMD_FR3]|uniref:hypothetical protein n=1 Tax=Phaeovulum sp. W22_SRMD_FR3 TaxID=3240274 RepID=UPI003F9A34D3
MRKVMHGLWMLPMLGSMALAAGAPLAPLVMPADNAPTAVARDSRADLTAQIAVAQDAAARCLLDLGITPAGLTADQPDTTLVPLTTADSVIEVPETAASPATVPLTLADDGIEVIALTSPSGGTAAPTTGAAATTANASTAADTRMRLLTTRNLDALCAAVTQIGAQRS